MTKQNKKLLSPSTKRFDLQTSINRNSSLSLLFSSSFLFWPTMCCCYCSLASRFSAFFSLCSLLLFHENLPDAYCVCSSETVDCYRCSPLSTLVVRSFHLHRPNQKKENSSFDSNVKICRNLSSGLVRIEKEKSSDTSSP